MPKTIKTLNDAKEALSTHFKKLPNQDDYAQILHFLSDVETFDRCFKDVSKEVGVRYELGKQFTKNMLTYTFDVLFVRYGTVFPRVQNIVLVGASGGVFGTIVTNGLLFKDGTGPSHGEYSHMIQWLVIAYANHASVITLTNSVFDLYKGTVGPKATSTTEFYSVDPNGHETEISKPTPIPVWVYLLDCFPGEGHGPTVEEDNDKRAISPSYRSPSYLTRQMLSGRLFDTWLGHHLNNRYKKREVVLEKREAETLRLYHMKKGTEKKERVFVGKVEGTLFTDGNILVPSNAFDHYSISFDKDRLRSFVGTMKEKKLLKEDEGKLDKVDF